MVKGEEVIMFPIRYTRKGDQKKFIEHYNKTIMQFDDLFELRDFYDYLMKHQKPIWKRINEVEIKTNNQMNNHYEAEFKYFSGSCNELQLLYNRGYEYWQRDKKNGTI